MDERQKVPPHEPPRPSTPETNDEPIEGGGVAQGDIRIPRHPKEEQSQD
jgi:hypothetical protein